MRHVAFVVVLASCVPDGPPEWQLDRDRIVAVRAEPPALAPGTSGGLVVLVAHEDGATSVETPLTMSAPGPLFTAVHYNIDHYQLDCPDAAQLAAARAELGLVDNAPVPLDVELRVAGPLYATKRVLLGVAADNPALPLVTIDGLPPGASIALERQRSVSLLIEANAPHWFTSCGELRADREASATLVTSGECDGELAVVVRDGQGGVVWSVWPLTVR